MQTTVETICLKNQFGRVNCYLIKAENSFFLIDTGWTNRRSVLENRLEKTGCNENNLGLIILTHGDFDHCGNCFYLSRKYNAKIAMHQDDSGMVEYGDMFWNRKKPNPVMKLFAQAMFKLKTEDRFKPQVYLNDGQDLKEYNFDASVIHLPGHSRGSVGILTSDGALICGDLFENIMRPSFSSIMDDPWVAKCSMSKLERENVNMVYPGHGEPFRMEELLCREV